MQAVSPADEMDRLVLAAQKKSLERTMALAEELENEGKHEAACRCYARVLRLRPQGNRQKLTPKEIRAARVAPEELEQKLRRAYNLGWANRQWGGRPKHDWIGIPGNGCTDAPLYPVHLAERLLYGDDDAMLSLEPGEAVDNSLPSLTPDQQRMLAAIDESPPFRAPDSGPPGGAALRAARMDQPDERPCEPREWTSTRSDSPGRASSSAMQDPARRTAEPENQPDPSGMT